MGNLKEWHTDVIKIKKEILSIEATTNSFRITSTENTMDRFETTLTVLRPSLQTLSNPSRMLSKHRAFSVTVRLESTP